MLVLTLPSTLRLCWVVLKMHMGKITWRMFVSLLKSFFSLLLFFFSTHINFMHWVLVRRHHCKYSP